MLLSLACGILAAGAPSRAGDVRVVENGTLDIPLRGYPEPPPPPKAPARQGYPSAPSPSTAGGMTAPGGMAANTLSRTVGRLGVTIAPSSEIYRQRDPRSTLLARLPSNTPFCIRGQQDGYYAVLMIDGSIGWIPATSVQLLDYDVVAEPQPSQPSLPSRPGISERAAAVLQEAQRYMGVRYLWGGNGPRGIDCSGLVKNVFAKCGISLPRTAHEQARVGVPVAFGDLRPGDRLYFSVKHQGIDHTGIYLGGGLFIHSSLSRGEVAVDRLSKPLYGPNLVDARRL